MPSYRTEAPNCGRWLRPRCALLRSRSIALLGLSFACALSVSVEDVVARGAAFRVVINHGVHGGPQLQVEVVPQQAARPDRATSVLDVLAGNAAGAIALTEGAVTAPEASASVAAARSPLRSL